MSNHDIESEIKSVNDSLIESRRKFPLVIDLLKTDNHIERASKIISLIQADYQKFASLIDPILLIKPDVELLIINQELILDEPYTKCRTNKLRELNEPYSTTIIVSIQLARQMLNHNQVYND